MLIRETITTQDGRELLKHYSDNNKYIIQTDTGIKYGYAIDPIDTTHTYEESNEDLPVRKTKEKEG